jgi:type I restriction enzyme S subunit
MQGRRDLPISFYKVKHLAGGDSNSCLGPADDMIDEDTARQLGATIVPAGAFVYAKVGAALMLGRIRTLPTDACIDNNLSALVPSGTRFAHSYLRWALQLVRFDELVNPGAVPSLSDKNFLSYRIPDPPLPEQVAIARFLDRETTQIDTLIAKQEQLIGTLRERRAVVIEDLALQGYRPLHHNPEIEQAPIGALFTVTLGKMLDAGKEAGEHDVVLPYVRAANIQDGGLQLDDINTMPFSETEATRLDLRKNDLLVVEGGAVGTSVLLDRDMPNWSFQKTVNRIRTRGGSSPAWLRYVIRSYRDSGVIDLICDGSTIPHLTAEKLRALRVPATDPRTQAAIVTRLDDKTSKIDALIAKAEQLILLAKERRGALITAAVTGRIDVSKAA